jgi:hypothetical protein
MLHDFVRVIRIVDGMDMHPMLTEATCHECMVLKGKEILGELQMTVRTRHSLIGFDAKRQDHSDKYTKCDNR